MIDSKERKSPEEIKLKILEALNEKPLNALEISKQIGSNWSTVKTYVEELVKEGKIKEITFGGNQILYQKITGDTYFNIPLKEEQREMFKFILSGIISEYKSHLGRLPKKTELAKASVEVIERANIKDLPLVWYLYGMIPLMIVDPLKDYSTNFIPEDKPKLQKIIITVVTENSKMRVSELKLEQYNRHNRGLYLEKNNLTYNLTKENNPKDILEGFKNLYLKIDIEKNKESFVYFDNLYFLVRAFNDSDELDENRSKIILALESCWKLIALENFIESLSLLPQYNKSELVEFYLDSVIIMQKNIIQEYLDDLNENYVSKMKRPELSKEAQEARKIMENWTGE